MSDDPKSLEEDKIAKKRAAIRKIMREVEEELLNEFDHNPETIDDIEDQSHRIGERVKRIVSERAIRDKEVQDRQSSRSGQHCDCGQKARYVGVRKRQIVLRFGIQFLDRCYFQCGKCQSCFAPLDNALKLGSGQFSRFVAATAVRLNAVLTDRQVASELDLLLGISISVSTIQRRSHEVGQHMKDAWDTQGEQMKARRLPASQYFPSRLHTSADGVMIHIGGRWQEVKTASVFETDEKGNAIHINYFASHTGSQQFGLYWRILVHQAGMDHCADVAVVADGARWIWIEVGKYFPQSKQIVDFCHVMGYVWSVANLRFGMNSQEAAEWAKKQSELLKSDAHATVRQNALDWKPRKPENLKVRKDLVGYIDQNASRMNYGSFLNDNYQIGSGVEESCNKNVVQARMKRAGMRWGEMRSESILHLCSWYYSQNRQDIGQYLA